MNMKEVRGKEEENQSENISQKSHEAVFRIPDFYLLNLVCSIQ